MCKEIEVIVNFVDEPLESVEFFAVKGDPGDSYTLTPSDKAEIAQLVDVPSEIDDTAGDGVTDKTWSADKIVDALKSAGTVQDVQIAGTSIVNEGVAEIPVSGPGKFGIIMVSGYGLQMQNNGYISTRTSESIDIKNGNRTWEHISPFNQHMSTFYGLAKAAGDTTQSQSSNAVGKYTEEAKIAIQKMLGIYEPPYELLNDFALEEEGRIDLTADMYGTPYDLRNVLIQVTYPADLASVASGYGRYQCFDDMGRHTNAETGRYSTNTAMSFKRITTERKANLTFSYYTKQTSTGGSASLLLKDINSRGISIDLGNITRIACIDTEPAGTQIKIYGQRAY